MILDLILQISCIAIPYLLIDNFVEINLWIEKYFDLEV